MASGSFIVVRGVGLMLWERVEVRAFPAPAVFPVDNVTPKPLPGRLLLVWGAPEKTGPGMVPTKSVTGKSPREKLEVNPAPGP
jgi:hypothetical protein